MKLDYPFKLLSPPEGIASCYFVFLSEIRHSASGDYRLDVDFFGPVAVELGNDS